MADHIDVIVVGVGTMGSSTCYHLAKRGVRVLGLEKFDIPHEHGSSHGFSRMIRLAYYEHPDYVALLRRAFDLWEELENDCGQRLLYLTGGLYMGRPDSDLVSGSRRSALQHNIEHVMLDRSQLRQRFAQFHLPHPFVGFHEEKAGFLVPERVVAAQAEQALRRGARLHGREAVIGWETSASGVRVRTEKTTYTADQLIICGGAWSGKLLKDLGVELTVTRQVLGWVWPRQPQFFQLGKFPCWAIDLNPPEHYQGLHYGFPMMPDNPGLKIALHWPMRPTDPDAVEREPLPGDEDTFRPVLQRLLPNAYSDPLSLLSLRTCLYTSSPDSHFIIDRHPQRRLAHDRVTIACGFSGHGFKFASVVGQVLADLATEGKTPLPIEFLRLSRFSKK